MCFVSRAFRPAPDLALGCAGVMKRMVVQAGGLAALAPALGVGPSQAQRYGDAGTPDLPCFAQVAAAVSLTGATAPAEFLAELAGGRFSPGAAALAGDPRLALIDLLPELSEGVFRISETLRDGQISAAEVRCLERAFADLEDMLASAKASLRTTKRRTK